MTPSPASPKPPLPPPSKWALLATGMAGFLVLLSFAFPLWTLHLTAPQYPETLNLHVYAYKFEGSGNPNMDDIVEINTLNHYIGMREIHEQDFPELKWMPLALGVAALGLAATAFFAWYPGLWINLGILTATALAGLGSAFYKLYLYGHHLDPDAPLKVAPFTPPFLGSNKLVNFETHGFFGVGGYMLLLAWALAGAALYYGWRRRRRHAAS